MAVWIAVTTDIISKIRELAGNGDLNATAFIADLDTAIKTTNIPQLLKIEAELLDKARNDFEFLNNQEFVDLTRIKDDRNLCAHPAFVGEEILYQPYPDQVRTHIVHAVEHLLKQQPVQGKAALEKISFDLRQSTYPTDYANIKNYLFERYFKRAKTALTRNFIIILVKDYLRIENSEFVGCDHQMLLSLKAISEFDPALYEQVMSETLPKVAATLNEQQMKRVFRLIGTDQRCWSWLGEAERIRVSSLLKKMNNKEIVEYNGFALIEVPELHDYLYPLLDDENERALSNSEKMSVFIDNPRPEFYDLAIENYKASGSYYQAGNVAGSIIVPFVGNYSPAQIIAVLDAAAGNEQIYYSKYTPAQFAEIFDKTIAKLPELKVHWKAFINTMHQKNGTDGYYSYPALTSKLQQHQII